MSRGIGGRKGRDHSRLDGEKESRLPCKRTEKKRQFPATKTKGGREILVNSKSSTEHKGGEGGESVTLRSLLEQQKIEGGARGLTSAKRQGCTLTRIIKKQRRRKNVRRSRTITGPRRGSG